MTDINWEEFLKRHPMPELSKLVGKYQGYDKIPEAAWKEYRAQCERWEIARKDRLFGGVGG